MMATLVIGYIFTHWWSVAVTAILALLALAGIGWSIRAIVRDIREERHDPQHKASRPRRTSRSRAGKARAARRLSPQRRAAPATTDDDRTLWWLRAIGGKHPRWMPYAIQARIAGLEVITSAAIHDAYARERSARLAHSIGAGGMWPAPTDSGAASAPDAPGPACPPDGNGAPDGLPLQAAAAPAAGPGAHLPAPIPHDGPWEGHAEISHDEHRPAQTWHEEPPEPPWGTVPPVAALVAAVRGLPSAEYVRQLAAVSAYRDERPLRDCLRTDVLLKLTPERLDVLDAEWAARNGGA